MFLHHFLAAVKRQEGQKGHPSSVSEAVTKDHMPCDTVYMESPGETNPEKAD